MKDGTVILVNSIKLRIHLPYDPVIKLLGIYTREMNTQDIHLQIIAELFIITKTWNSSRYPSTGEWINKLWCIHAMKYYSEIERNELLIQSST